MEDVVEDSVENTIVSITYAELMKLRTDSHKLAFLQSYGVDEWSGYDEALSAYCEWLEEEGE